ncbi:hypothetical protein [Parendozoicomonas sp. Alg238-R29]|uniref:hypothetical protein n=1 Tax=Parendozoicomonas sp. Alg238-R29 TaxID=2993446 RepID=UPI00248DCC14|nr:hypothetical protein [Parendozoicomonas sp. Alg238-R29]
MPNKTPECADYHRLPEAITCALQAVTKPGDIVAINSPTYYAIIQALEALHLKALEIPEGTRATCPKGGILLWIELPEGVDAKELSRQALINGISIAPGPMFTVDCKYELI